MRREESSGQPTLILEHQPVRGIFNHGKSDNLVLMNWTFEVERSKRFRSNCCSAKHRSFNRGLNGRVAGGAREIVSIFRTCRVSTSFCPACCCFIHLPAVHF